MKSYTLHVPSDALAGDPAALDHAELVRDGFTWGAFVFTFLWFLAHRLWLAALGVFIVVIAFNFSLGALNIHPTAGFLAYVLLASLIGLEAASLKRWTYARRGRPAVDLVRAANADEAEAKAFARWLDGSAPKSSAPRSSAPKSSTPMSSAPAPRAGTPATSYRAPSNEPVIGLFPEPERPR
jgi:hypothetical protein